MRSVGECYLAGSWSVEVKLTLVREYAGNQQSASSQAAPPASSGDSQVPPPGSEAEPANGTAIGSAILIIEVNGEVDTNTAGALESSLTQEFDKGARLLILELSQMDYVSSVGLRVLLAHLKKIKSSQGRMVLTGLNQEVQEIFDMAGFSSLFEISPSLSEARQILQA